MAKTGLIVMTALIGLTRGADAHHSGAEGEPIEIEGVVTEVRMVNPHTQIVIRVEAGPGETAEWTVGAAPPAKLRYLGWTADTVRVGESVKIIGRPAGLADRFVDLDTVIFEDGRVLTASLPLHLQPGLMTK